MKKRLLAIIATMAMVVAMMPSMVFGAEVEVNSADAFKEQIAAGNSIKLTGSFSLNEEVDITTTGVTIDLAGYTITGTDTTNKNFGLLDVNKGAELTVKDSVGGGKITLTATTNSGWDRYSAVIANNQGTLTIDGGHIEHLGGTDMAYGIDSLTNGTNGDVTTTVNNGTIKSTYRAIRMFANSSSKSNNLIINGGTIEGQSAGIWLQSPNTAKNIASLEVEKGTITSPGMAIYGYATDNGNGADLEIKIGDDAVIEGSVKITDEFSVNNITVPDSFKMQKDPNTGTMTFACPHDNCEEINVVEATCDKDGYTGDLVCKDCGATVEKGEAIKATGHTYKDGKCTVCGEKAPVKPEKSPNTGDNTVAPFAVAGLVLAAMTAAVAARRRYN